MSFDGSLKRWIEPSPVDSGLAERLESDTRLPSLVCRLLVQRGVTDIDQARTFLAPRMEHLHDPFLMKGVRDAVDRLIAAREAGEVVAIHGDYDVDGLTSTTLLSSVLSRLGWSVLPFVPHRMKDGYGVSTRALSEFAEAGVRVVLTCDTGTSAASEVRHGMEAYGFDFLITDHHQATSDLPPAHALVNPHQAGCDYPFKELCGVGVAFKVLQALVRELGEDESEVLYPYLDLVALGTVADVVALRGENRVFVKWGLRAMRETRNLGLATLCEVAGIDITRISETDLGFGLGPRLNAVGRVDDAGKGLELLLAEDEETARNLSELINGINTQRRELSGAIYASALKKIESLEIEQLYGIALFGQEGDTPEWHHGVIGIVASRLVERFGRPTFLFARDEATGQWKGSGRAPAIGEVNLVEALNRCSQHLEKFGGHAAAAGATLKGSTTEELAAFARDFDSVVKGMMKPEERMPHLYADLDVTLDELNPLLHRELSRFRPFGAGNTAINMVARGVTIQRVRVLGQEQNHLKFQLEQGEVSFEAIAFRAAERFPELVDAGLPTQADFFFRLEENEWNGRRSLQLKVEDLRIPDSAGSAQARRKAGNAPGSESGGGHGRRVPAGSPGAVRTRGARPAGRVVVVPGAGASPRKLFATIGEAD